MIRKSTLLAVAASAALGLAMLAPTSASAHGGHGGGGGGHGHFGGRHFHPHWHVRWHRPIWYARPVVYGGYTVARPVVAGPCTCLSKEYTPEGAVVFKDRCTNEVAMNPPAQAPQQTGQLDTQQQASNAPYQQQYIQPTPANAQPAK